jgi:hypothetical protein
MAEDFQAIVAWLREFPEFADLDGASAYAAEFGWTPLPPNVIPLPRRSSDERP